MRTFIFCLFLLASCSFSYVQFAQLYPTDVTAFGQYLGQVESTRLQQRKLFLSQKSDMPEKYSATSINISKLWNGEELGLSLQGKGTLQQEQQDFTFFATSTSRNITLSSMSNVSACVGQGFLVKYLTILDDELSSVTLTTTTSNPKLIPASNITLRPFGTSHLLSITSTAGQSGTALITVIATNNVSQTASSSFVYTIIPVPSVSIVATPSLTISSGQTATLTAIGADSYVWSTSETSTAIAVRFGGLYAVNGTSQGCTGSAFAIVEMAPCNTFRTVKSGDWNDQTVWSCLVVPSATSVVEVNHALVLYSGYQAQALSVQYGLGGSIVYGIGSRLRLGM